MSTYQNGWLDYDLMSSCEAINSKIWVKLNFIPINTEHYIFLTVVRVSGHCINFIHKFNHFTFKPIISPLHCTLRINGRSKWLVRQIFFNLFEILQWFHFVYKYKYLYGWMPMLKKPFFVEILPELLFRMHFVGIIFFRMAYLNL